MSPNSLHSSFFRRFLCHPQPCVDVYGIEVLYVVDTGVSYDHMDIRLVVHLIGEGEKMFGVEENFVSERFKGVTCSLAFLAACV